MGCKNAVKQFSKRFTSPKLSVWVFCVLWRVWRLNRRSENEHYRSPFNWAGLTTLQEKESQAAELGNSRSSSHTACASFILGIVSKARRSAPAAAKHSTWGRCQSFSSFQGEQTEAQKKKSSHTLEPLNEHVTTAPFTPKWTEPYQSYFLNRIFSPHSINSQCVSHIDASLWKFGVKLPLIYNDFLCSRCWGFVFHISRYIVISYSAQSLFPPSPRLKPF